MIAATSVTDWQLVAPADLVLMDLANGRRVAFMLAPEIAPAHVANIRALVRARWFDGGAVYRVDDNYVVQWGQGESGKPTPEGLGKPLPTEYERAAAGFAMIRLPYLDAYARDVGYRGAFPVAVKDGRSWAVHCHGIVAAARDLSDSGNGGELYAGSLLSG